MTRRALLAFAPAAVVAAALAIAACGQAILTAPIGSTLHISANPTFVVANGGIAVISVLVTEPTGTVVPDGTVVQFFSDLGRIEEQGKTYDGVVRVNFTADSRSGTATITAISGGEAAPSTAPSSDSPTPGGTPTPGSTPTPTPTPTATPTPRGGGGGGFASLGTGDGVGSASLTIGVGSALPATLVLEAVPPRIISPRSSVIRAFVLDASGNPVAGVPLFFSLSDATGTERLESSGRPIFTDSNGSASDVLITTASTAAPPRAVLVRVSPPNGLTAPTVTVTIN